MKAVFRVAFDKDPRKSLQWKEDAPIPVITKPSQVRIKVMAIAANPADDKLNSGMMPIIPGLLGKAIGSDVAGVVDQVGDDAKADFQVGDRVFGCTGMEVGSFAEFVVADKGKFEHIPAKASFEEAAALPLAGCTALDVAKLVKQGDTVAVRGASGGIGALLTQLLVNRGAHVIAISSRVQLCQQLGAHEVIDYKTTSWPSRLAGRNLDVFVDLVGGDETWFASHAVLKPRGQFITAAGNFGDSLTVGGVLQLLGAAIYRFVAHRLTSAPSYQLTFSTESKEKIGELAAMIEQGTLRAVLDPACPLPSFSFDNVVLMMQRMKLGDAQGKIVCRVN
jgi:NADPH:quinone reductase-like Zn-dependent oxidoreductase